MYDNICLEKLRSYTNLLENATKKKYRAILEAAMVSTTKEFTDNSPMSPSQYVIVKILVK